MKQKHLLSLREYSPAEIEEIFDLARKVKAEPADYWGALERKSLAMIFQKPSTRTRVSFEVGMFQLGGTAVYLGAESIQLQRGETVADTAKVLSRYVDGIMARVFAHQDVVDLAKHGTVPVINGLSDQLHPCQALADFFTLLERRGKPDGLKLAYVGDGNNVCHELMLGAVKLGVAMSVAAPAAYQPNPLILKSAQRDAQKEGTPPPVVTPIRSRRCGAPTSSTPTSGRRWARRPSPRRASRPSRGFMVTPQMMAAAAQDAVFMHCLPAHRGEEVAAEVMDGPQSVVFEQAENRLHVQKALLILLLGGR